MRAFVFLSLALISQLAASAPNKSSAALKTIRVNDMELHYVDLGSGPPVIFVHGGLGDYREWRARISRFSARHRVIAYSRRYNYPNTNSESVSDHSALIEAKDLGALIDVLKLERVHLFQAGREHTGHRRRDHER